MQNFKKDDGTYKKMKTDQFYIFKLCGMVTSICMGFQGGCANARPYTGIDLSSYHDTVLINELPSIMQSSTYQCGYASMASVSLYYRVNPKRLTGGIVASTFSCKSLSAKDLKLMAQKLGLAAYAYKGSLSDLKNNLAKKRPVLVLLNQPRTAKWPSIEWSREVAGANLSLPHWVVAIGICDKAKEIILQDPIKGRLVMLFKDFQKTWNEKSRVCVLVGVLQKQVRRGRAILRNTCD